MSKNKVVINNTRKSMMIPKNYSPSRNGDNGSKKSMELDKVQMMRKEVENHKQKSDKNLIKVRFLYDKLKSYGGMQQIPEDIVKEISSTDLKIRKLQNQLGFKKSTQMQKLKMKVSRFLSMLDYEVSREDMDKIEDEVEIILFLIDIFSEKYRELMEGREEIDEIIERLTGDNYQRKEMLEQRLKQQQQKNASLVSYIGQIDLELHCLRNKKRDGNMLNQNVQSYNNKFYEENVKVVEEEMRKYEQKANYFERQLKKSQIEKSELKKRQTQLQLLVNEWKSKCRKMEFELEDLQKDDLRWKERYIIMEKQKNERIKLLQEEGNLASSQMIPSERKKSHRMTFGPVEQISFSQQNSSTEYYDL